jgi:hypothetical protein
MSALGKKIPGHFHFFSSVNKLKRDHQSELNSATSWTPKLWKASLGLAVLRKVALPAGQFQSCLCIPAEWTSEQHTPYVWLLYLPIRNIIQHRLWAYWIPPPKKKKSLKTIGSKLQSNTRSWAGVVCRTFPSEGGWGKESNSQWMKVGKVTKHENRGGVTRQPSKGEQVVESWAGLMSLRLELKTELSHLVGAKADHMELQL